MAETYKGLTIRIGGETTGLQRALKSADSAIASTNTQLRKMTQALRMDPSSTKAMSSQLDLMGDKAVETSNRVAKLRAALRQISDEHVDINFGDRIETTGQTLRQISDQTEDVSKRAADAAQRYNDVDAALEKIYRDINRVAKETGEMGEGFDMHEAVQDLDSIKGKLIETGTATSSQIQRLESLRAVWEDAFEENEIGKALLKMRDLETETIKAEAAAKQAARQFTEMALNASRVELSGDLDNQLNRLEASSKDSADALHRAQQALKMDPGNADAATEAMRQLQQSAQLASRRIEVMEDKLSRLKANGIQLIADNTDDAADAARVAAERFEEMTYALDRARGKLAQLSDAQQKLNDGGDTQTAEYEQLSAEIEQATVEVRQLEAALRQARDAAETAQQVQEYRELEGQIAQTRAELSQYNAVAKSLTSPGKMLSSNTLMELGMTLSTSVTPAIVAMGAYAIDAANNIDSAYRDMRKTVNGTEEDFEALRQAAVDFSTTHVTGADQILEIQAIGGELGVAVEDLETFATTVSNLEVATDLDADEAATSLGQLDNIMNDLSGSTMPAFSDALVRLGNNGASTESQIVEIAKRIGAMGSIVGMSTPEVLAWASSIASTGQNAEAAGTAISNTMSDIETAVAGGGEALEAFAQVSGMSAQQFADMWSADSSTAMKSFIEGLVRIEESGGSADATLQDLGITAVRQKQAIEGIMQTIGGLGENLQMSNNAWNGVSDQWGEAGDAANEAEKKAEGFSGSLARMQNVAQVLASELGESLTPMIDAVADVLGDLGQWFAETPDGFKQMVAAAGTLTAALGPLLLAGRAISSARKDLQAFRAAFGAASSAADAAGTAIGGLKGGLIGLGVAIAGIGITALVSHLAEMEEEARVNERATTGLAEACKMAGESMASEFESAESLSDRVKEVAEASDSSTQRLADLADEFDELNVQAAGTLSRFEQARSAIMYFGGQSDLTSQQLGELMSAVGFLNQQCGTNYQVVQDAGGAYQIMSDGAMVAKDAIYDLIDAQKLQTQVSAQNQKLEGLYGEYAQQSAEYSDALETQAEAQERYNKAYSDYVKAAESGASDAELADLNAIQSEALKNLDTANEAVTEIERNMDSTSAAIDATNATIGNISEVAEGAVQGFDALVKASTGVNEAFGGNETLMQNFADALEESGYSLEYFSGLSDREMQKLATSFANSGGTIGEILAQMGADAVSASEDVLNALMAFDNGQFANAITQAGINVGELSTAFTMAGISSQQLNAIGSENLAALAANCNGSISNMIFMIQHYNDVPIYNKDGTITIDQTSLVDAEGNVYTWNGEELFDKYGNIYTNYVELMDAYGNVITYNGTELEPKETDIKCDRSELITGMSTIDSFKNLDGTTVTTYIDTVYRTFYKSSGSASSSTGTLAGDLGGVHRSAPAPASLQALAAASRMGAATDTGISLMSDTATQAAAAASRAKAAIAPLAARASDIARNLSVTVERSSTAGAVRSMARNMTRTPPYPGSGIRETGNSAVNITIDGIGTTGRVQSIALDLLDELERVGAI